MVTVKLCDQTGHSGACALPTILGGSNQWISGGQSSRGCSFIRRDQRMWTYVDIFLRRNLQDSRNWLWLPQSCVYLQGHQSLTFPAKLRNFESFWLILFFFYSSMYVVLDFHLLCSATMHCSQCCDRWGHSKSSVSGTPKRRTCQNPSAKIQRVIRL